MEPNHKVIQRAVEKLYDDETLRSNLIDAEAEVVFGWAERWLTTQISDASNEDAAIQISQRELPRVRRIVKQLNALAEDEAISLAQAITALESILDMQSLARLERFQVVTEWISTLWRIKDESDRQNE